jgi:plasmid stabilization system protein ParE
VIRLSRSAREQVSSLSNYYSDLDRPEAVRNLRAIIAKAIERIEAQRGLFFPAPRPYPNLRRQGWIWLKQGPYWIAYASDREGAVIRAIFHETADIPSRI